VHHQFVIFMEQRLALSAIGEKIFDLAARFDVGGESSAARADYTARLELLGKL